MILIGSISNCEQESDYPAPASSYVHGPYFKDIKFRNVIGVGFETAMCCVISILRILFTPIR